MAARGRGLDYIVIAKVGPTVGTGSKGGLQYSIIAKVLWHQGAGFHIDTIITSVRVY